MCRRHMRMSALFEDLSHFTYAAFSFLTSQDLDDWAEPFGIAYGTGEWERPSARQKQPIFSALFLRCFVEVPTTTQITASIRKGVKADAGDN